MDVLDICNCCFFKLFVSAMSWSDPITCYVLDAVLLLYCIVFTALYFRIKVGLLFRHLPMRKVDQKHTSGGLLSKYFAL
uniref:Uncharacterized protein n=1 Tax=Electrophorus electricus TaxID=8005 RepID=A0A4W4EEG5_ELEEL